MNLPNRLTISRLGMAVLLLGLALKVTGVLDDVDFLKDRGGASAD